MAATMVLVDGPEWATRLSVRVMVLDSYAGISTYATATVGSC